MNSVSYKLSSGIRTEIYSDIQGQLSLTALTMNYSFWTYFSFDDVDISWSIRHQVLEETK